jgi:hypothetical protein
MLVYEQGRRFDEWAASQTPFKLLFAGYELFEDNDDGSWWRMLQPDATGYGICVSTVKVLSDCNYYYYNMADSTVGSHMPWFLPAVVKWVSPFTKNEIGETVLTDESWQFMMDFPFVGIEVQSAPQTLDRFIIDNVHVEYDWDRDFRNEHAILNNNLINGVVPFWSVLPIREEFVDGFRDAIGSFSEIHKTDLLYFNCDCIMEDVHSDECASVDDYSKNCNCNYTAEIVETILTMLEEQPEPTQYMDPLHSEIWNIAIDNEAKGWEVVHKYSERESPWAYYSQLHQSPFSDSPGQSVRDQRASTSSINSETLQAS